MDTLDETTVRTFFGDIVGKFPARSRPKSIIITHLLPDRPFLIEALSQQTEIVALLPKPKSIDQYTRDWLSHKYNIVDVRREQFNDRDFVLKLLSLAKGDPIVLMDIGGYFAATLNEVSASYAGEVLGVVEDTENGIQKYEALAALPCPVVSVARSPLKNPEDYLVGQSIVFSTEALLRQQGDILHGRTACVIGYGKLGRSIANLLHARHVRTRVFDTEPTTLVEAMSHGFPTARTLEDALQGAGLVFCATGNKSLRATAFNQLDRGAYVATVTSSDDELELAEVDRDYETKQITDYITRYRKRDHHFYMLNRGQAVNFIHGAAVGPFIYLVHGEIVASVARITNGALPCEMMENDQDFRATIAGIWLRAFGSAPIRANYEAQSRP